MEQKQLNSLARDYLVNGCNVSYETLYRAMDGLRRINRNVLARMGYREHSDADSVFNDTFHRVINREITDCFKRLLSSSLKNARIDFDRKEKRRLRRESPLDAPTSIDPDAPTLGSTLRYTESENPTEDEALEKKKRAESIKLIDSLLESSQDSLTTTIVNLLPYYDTENALAKALGVHNMVVRRKLRGLARHYDANRFGDIRDYLAV